jgi:hypothetical protein
MGASISRKIQKCCKLQKSNAAELPVCCPITERGKVLASIRIVEKYSVADNNKDARAIARNVWDCSLFSLFIENK